MPELPEVETIRRGLVKVLEGRLIVRAKALRSGMRHPFHPDMENILEGYRIKSIVRRGKYLVISSADGRPYIVVHFGMSGKMLAFPSPEWGGPGKHDHLYMETDDGSVVVLNDPRRFGFMILTDNPCSYPGIAALGPEPLDEGFNGRVLLGVAGKGQRTLKAALMDQRVVAGLGNIYVCEALFMAGLSPFRHCSSLLPEEAERLAEAIKEVLKRAIDAGGSTLKDYFRPDGKAGYFQHSFSVYGRKGEKCPGCSCHTAGDGRIRKVVQGGRATFFCPTRQK